nr:replication initiation protein [Corynebacterium endometrii]
MESAEGRGFAAAAVGELLDHDPHFSHRFSRNPFHTGKAPTAYRWYR